HADWQGLTETIAATRAERVLVTHGYTPPLVRYLTDLGLDAHALETAFTGEEGSDKLDADKEATTENEAGTLQ
ncbi:MAG: DNA ligase-associated DEXH box helicase, partial [Cyanobacteria bacterium PR.023]|nr:DNA ligase-associated DEXH box helicase [Cyanobacteria bacterium PR.023]